MAYVSSEELCKNFDVIVYGTGLTESIIAAALCRNGVSVLHLDSNQFYGGESASLMHREFLEFLEAISLPAPPRTEVPTIEPSKDQTSNQRYFLHSSLSRIYENIEQEFVEQESTSPVDTQSAVQPVSPAANSSAAEVVCSKNTEESQATSNQPTEHLPSNINSIQTPNNESEQSNSEVDPPSLPTSTLHPNAIDPTTPTELASTAQDEDIKVPYVPQPATKPTGPVLSWTELKSQYRMFTFDLWPKLIYATDPFVDLIVKSTITKYLEFKAVNMIITVLDRNLTLVPASRADVFTSKSVSVLEKRLLMRFVTFVIELDKHEEELERFKSRPFTEFMHHLNLNAKLQSLIKSSIAQVEEGAFTGVALERSKFYLQSIGRYSNSPYLWPVYGLGELPQAFCRMSAVFGGCYMLRKEIQYLNLIQTEGVTKCTSVCDAESTTFTCKHLILGASLVPDIHPTVRYSRAIVATNRKLSPSHSPDVKSDIGFITIPSYALGADQPHTIKAIELSPNSQSSADRCYLVHLTCLSSKSTARTDLLPAVEFLFHNTVDTTDKPPRPKALYSIYFNYNSTQSPAADKFQLADNVYLISSPDFEPSYQQILNEAKGVFNSICPGDTFLPPPPDPEDIIYEPTTPEPPEEADGGAVPESAPDSVESYVIDQTKQ